MLGARGLVCLSNAFECFMNLISLFIPLIVPVENGKNTQGGNSSVDYSASLEGQSNERGPVLRQLATWLLQVQ